MQRMDASTMITVGELRAAVGLLLDEVERKFGPTIDLNADYYWEIGVAAAFDLDANPSEAITAGQLTDDVTSVREFISRSPEDFAAVWHEASHLTGILRRLAAMDLPTP